jgi:hypothetical protein
LFAARLGLPVQGYVPLSDGVLASLRHLVLPALTVSLILMALIVRMTRASVLGVLREDYIRTAWAKGLASRSVLLRHALKNAALPIVTVVGLGFALLVGGVVVTESVFAIPGIGRLTVMGGTVYGRGNTTPAAEFNIYADPEAAAVVFAAGLDTVVVPWEPCVSHCIPGSDVDALFASVPDSDYKTFSLALASHARKTLAGRGKGDWLRFVDPFAAAVVVEPAIVTRSLRASVDVALAAGLTRGMTVVDPSGRLGTPPVTLVEEARLDRLTALYARSIAGSG